MNKLSFSFSYLWNINLILWIAGDVHYKTEEMKYISHLVIMIWHTGYVVLSYLITYVFKTDYTLIPRKKFEDTKRVIRSHILKNDRQYNGQKKKRRRSSNIYKMYTKKTIDWAKRTLLNTQMCRKSEQSLLF